MKLLKNVFFFLFVFTLSCSSSDDSDDQQQEEGSISITFSDGRSYILENITATLSNDYSTSNQLTINIVASSPLGTGTLTMAIIDNEDSFTQLINENSFPFAVTEGGFYVTLSYIDNESTFYAQTGTLDILNFEADGNNSELTAIFNTSNGNGLTMSGSVLDIVMNCLVCE